MSTRLYIGNLSYHTTDSAIQSHFSQAGAVTSVSIIMDKFTGRSRGFAFVEMASDADAKKAIDELHGRELDGRPLTVNEARPRTEGGGPRREFRSSGREQRSA
jgi:cold-inducible RNA-binding protein